ncbi:GerAB/ArcD/ProY family transporter [Paenibacillus ginsengarvi]|uniref:Spore gernimation protein n=1 Tax=Paenibacillus ginsengarvi TaxID=400777 RepID=A0A3B0AX08_9BACL|nr:endospore germination permease [Paenibacillus ginsengarvi]RKN64874.1 spore gernimation protein [Paenibacillus ginsengarvi]
MKPITVDRITLLQYVFIINGYQIGVGVLSLPRELAEKAGTDGWVALLISWAIGSVCGIAWIKTMETFPSLTPFQLFEHLFGKTIGKLAISAFVLYYGFFTWLIMTKTMLYIKTWLLPKTPDYLIVGLIAFPILLIARSGIRDVGRFCELVFYMTTWMLLVVLIPIKEGTILNLLPVFKEGVKPVIDAVEVTVYSMSGFEISAFLYPYLQNKKYAVHGMLAANTLTMLTYLLVTLTCFIYFSPAEVVEYNQPVLNLLKVIEFRFVERFDMIFYAAYILVTSTAWLPVWHFASRGFAALIGTRKHAPIVVAVFVLCVGLTYAVHPTWNQSEQFSKLAAKAGIVLAYLLPLCLLAYVKVFKKISKRREAR